jgi:hypothetical protein
MSDPEPCPACDGLGEDICPCCGTHLGPCEYCDGMGDDPDPEEDEDDA